MSPLLITALLFATLFFLILAGLPIAFAIGGTAMIYALLLWGPESLYLIASSASGVMSNLILIAIPLFVLMANFLERSGVAEALYKAAHHWMGPLRGGLSVGTVIICTIFAAMSGLSATATVTMGLIALPAMIKRGYDKRMTMGAIMAGGALGQLIPPSVMFIFYGMLSRQSVGKLFMGGVIPGLISSGIFIIYILIRCFFNKELGPPLPVEERVGWREKFVLLKGLIIPALLVLFVLGSIYLGINTPTEAAAIGAFGAIISAAIHRRLNWKMVKDTCTRTLSVSAMVMFIIFSSVCLSGIYTGIGGPKVINSLLLELPGGRWMPIILMQVILLALGCFLDPGGIMMICVPIFLPVVKALGFDPIWFGVLFVMNMEIAFLTPPVGANLFYMKGVAPKDVTIADIYHAALPFIGLQAISLIAVMIWPQLVLWLPGTMNR
jgi:tripartite ATP-independent transporter DctM subunit